MTYSSADIEHFFVYIKLLSESIPKHHVIQLPWCIIFPISSNVCTTPLQN